MAQNPREAANFSRPEGFSEDDFRRRAKEFINIVRGLWVGWEPDALLFDNAVAKGARAEQGTRVTNVTFTPGDRARVTARRTDGDEFALGPQVRAWQAEALRLPNTGMAVTVDVGDAKSVHPKNKAPVGDRLSRIALAKVYGRQIEYSGPVFESMTVDAGTQCFCWDQAIYGTVCRYNGGNYERFFDSGY